MTTSYSLLCLVVLLSSTCHASAFLPLARPTVTTGRLCDFQRCLPFMVQQDRHPKAIRLRQSSRISLASQDGDTGAVSEDLEPLENLFNKYCDSDGLMGKAAVMSVPFFAELLAEGDMLVEEFDAVWTRAPKFPEVATSGERVDVDSFVQIYRDIDDLFEDEGDSATAAAAVVNSVKTGDKYNDGDSQENEAMEAELEAIFKSICDKDSLLSFDRIKEWDEVQKLLEDGLLGDDELEALWSRTKKAPGSVDCLDVDGFLSFNIELDGLFEFDDGELEEEDFEADAIVSQSESRPRTMVDGDDLPVAVLFSSLMGRDGKVGLDDLSYWSELKEMISAGDLLESEFEGLFIDAGQGKPRLDETEFGALAQAIDNLFENDEEDMDQLGNSSPSQSDADMLKQELLEALERFDDPDLLPCGLDFNEKEQKEILSIVSDLEGQPCNLVRRQASNIQVADLAGVWDLVYSSSSAMRFNKGLSGIGGSFPNGRFAGVTQNLKASKYLTDVEYLERIEVNPSSASFDVKVTGSWDLQKSVSLFTGEPSVVLTIVPDMVTYGPTFTRADHWKSLGPTNMLDITYLDNDLRIMRGNTAVENIFIYRRSKR
ncbi:hypothetical protein MPSEU_000601500 [Mayamaea pseudoterrestris]|nr:hypothetical protein MPSEU_000601500 [Mayamaea pseudoterrestris]